MLGNFILNVLLASSLSKLFKIVGQIQMIVFISLISINFPSNMSSLLVKLSTIAEMDYIPEQWKKNLYSTKEKMVENQKFVQNGFKRTNFLENIGGFAVFIAGLLIAMTLLCLMRTILKIVEKSLSSNNNGRCSKILKLV